MPSGFGDTAHGFVGVKVWYCSDEVRCTGKSPREESGFGEKIGCYNDHQDDDDHEGENSPKRKKISKHGTYVFRESSSGQANESELAEKVSQELVEEMSETVDEAKLRKKRNFNFTISTKDHSSCSKLSKRSQAPVLSLVSQDLFYQKKGNSGPEKFILSLHKFPIVIFLDDDNEERTSKLVDKCMKKFNPYARYSVKH
uniref:Uncharacterized protein n=1 Tax=Tanacetum cinerariifolium TaxID=118510 RepID=A0A6L2P4V4_TANCI|nr:hypothetical protein [Tanacetum cinerariifolium]